MFDIVHNIYSHKVHAKSRLYICTILFFSSYHVEILYNVYPPMRANMNFSAKP